MDRKLLFQQQAQEKPGDGVSLPSPRTGFYEVGSFKRSFQRIKDVVVRHSLSLVRCLFESGSFFLEVFLQRREDLRRDVFKLSIDGVSFRETQLMIKVR